MNDANRQSIRTKIVATLGPATNEEATIRKLIRAGMNVARLNVSHGTHTDHEALISSVRKAAAAEDAVVAIMQDLQGPRLRIGEVVEGTVLEAGESFRFDRDPEVGDASRVTVSYAHYLSSSVRPGQRILLDDGRIELRVEDSEPGWIETEVIVGGELSSRKGVNLPDTNLSIMSPTEKDLEDVRFGLRHGVDYIALSFVGDAAQVKALKAFISAEGGDVPVVAKIERPEAVAQIEAIVDAADALMVARGDLALEIGAAGVPVVQKRIIRLANEAGKPVITATQMLDSMIRSPKPTRAETSDVANAIYDGSDAVMLSGETAIGSYPVAAVRVMADIARETEPYVPYDELGRRGEAWARRSIDAAICSAAVDIASRAGAAAIIAATSSGLTPRAVAVHRPSIPLVGATTLARTQRRMALIWGVVPLMVSDYQDTDEMVRVVMEACVERDLVAEGDRVVITSGQPIGRPGSTNMVQVRHIGDWRHGNLRRGRPAKPEASDPVA